MDCLWLTMWRINSLCSSLVLYLLSYIIDFHLLPGNEVVFCAASPSPDYSSQEQNSCQIHLYNSWSKKHCALHVGQEQIYVLSNLILFIIQKKKKMFYNLLTNSEKHGPKMRLTCPHGSLSAPFTASNHIKANKQPRATSKHQSQ